MTRRLLVDPQSWSLERQVGRVWKSPSGHRHHKSSDPRVSPTWWQEAFVQVLGDFALSTGITTLSTVMPLESIKRHSTWERHSILQGRECTRGFQPCKRDLQVCSWIHYTFMRCHNTSQYLLVSIHSWNKLLARNVASTATALGKFAFRTGMYTPRYNKNITSWKRHACMRYSKYHSLTTWWSYL